MASSNVLIVGLQGLGVEIGMHPSCLTDYGPDMVTSAKDIVLAGVKSVTVYDPEPVTVQDLSSQVRRCPRNALHG